MSPIQVSAEKLKTLKIPERANRSRRSDNCRMRQFRKRTSQLDKPRMKSPTIKLHPQPKRLSQCWVRFRKGWSETPVAQISQMPFEYWVDRQVIGTRTLQEDLLWVVRPIDGDGSRIRDEEVINGDRGIDSAHFISHTRPGDVVNPCRMGCEQLRSSWRYPFWQVIVSLLRRPDLPAHDKKHYISAPVSCRSMICNANKLTILQPAQAGWRCPGISPTYP